MSRIFHIVESRSRISHCFQKSRARISKRPSRRLGQNKKQNKKHSLPLISLFSTFFYRPSQLPIDCSDIQRFRTSTPESRHRALHITYSDILPSARSNSQHGPQQLVCSVAGHFLIEMSINRSICISTTSPYQCALTIDRSCPTDMCLIPCEGLENKKKTF